MKPILDLSVYAIIDLARCLGRPLADLAAAAARGGATLIQLRAKTVSTSRFIQAAQEIQGALTPFAVPLLINDRVDVALAAGCDGVHLGAEDMPAEQARRLLGPRAIIGATVRTNVDVENMPVTAVNYASIGGVFTSRSKVNPEPPVGIGGFAELLRQVRARAPAPTASPSSPTSSWPPTSPRPPGG